MKPAFVRPRRLRDRTIALLTVLLLAGPTACTRTRPFLDASERALPGSIARMETIEVGGVDESVWIRGRNVSAPALILLHGGPGASESALMRHYVPQLEEHFLMVYWDQRGAGRSYHRRLARDSMTIERMVQDLDELVDRVRSEFGQERVVLLGHSWGTILGTRYAHEHPRRVAAYVGVGQVASFSEGERVSLAWAMEQAEAAGDEEAAAALGGMAPRPANVSEELELGRWVQHYGGYLREGLTTAKLIRAALATDEANLVDLWKFGAGNRFSLNALRAEYSREDLTRLRSFEVPVVFLLGRHDWHVPSVLAAEYFQRIDAPCKRLVWFEQSGHDPPFEEPDAFVRVLVKVVLPLAVRGCPAAAGTGGPPPRPGRVVRLAATPAGR